MDATRILGQFIELFSGWGLTQDDFCLCGEYGLRFNGYQLRPARPRHMDFFVVAKRLPWKTRSRAWSSCSSCIAPGRWPITRSGTGE